MGWGDAIAAAGAGAAGGAAAGPWGAVIGAGIGLFGSLFGAHMQSQAASESAQIEAAAQKYAADLAAKANADTLAFTKGQAENAFQNSEASRQGNYGMYAAAQRRLGSVGQLIGAGPREIPAYVPGVDPNFTGGASTGAAPTGGADPKIAAFIQQWQQDPAHPASEGIAPLATAIAQQFPGVSRYMYGQTPSDNELNIGGQKYKVLGGENSPAAYWYQPGMNDAAPGASRLGSVASYLQATPTPYAAVPVARALQMPGSVGSYLNG